MFTLKSLKEGLESLKKGLDSLKNGETEAQTNEELLLKIAELEDKVDKILVEQKELKMSHLVLVGQTAQNKHKTEQVKSLLSKIGEVIRPTYDEDDESYEGNPF